MQPAHHNQDGHHDEPSQEIARQTPEQMEFAEMAKSVEMDVFGYLLCRMKNRSDALELTQQVFLNAWKAWHRFDKSERVHAWFMAIAENVAIDHHRRATAEKRGKPQSLDAMFGRSGYDGDARGKFEPDDYRAPHSAHDTLETKEDREALEFAIPQLPQDDQTIIRLHLEHKTYAEIASATGRSLDAIGPALTRARARLGAILNPTNKMR